MRCPFCGHTNTSVKDSRSTDDDAVIRRRRSCPECQGRFSTIEHVQLLSLKVRKKQGVIEPFKREKLEVSLKVALHKRPIEPERFDKVINGIIRRLEVQGDPVIASTIIGEIVMEVLQDLDDVAYVRFASVYKNFHEAGDFNKFVKTLPTSK